MTNPSIADPRSGRMPVAFVSDHGPMPALDDNEYTRALGRVGHSLPRPRAIVVMSGHWEAEGGVLKATGAARPETIHDYSGFPEKFYAVRYPCPGDPRLAKDVVRRLEAAGFVAEADPQRGLDHGAWAPLSRLFPEADVPVVQLTVPSKTAPRNIMEIGAALAPLRGRGVLIVASGALIHNLRLVRMGVRANARDAWAEAFGQWLSTALASNDVAALTDYARRAPSARLAVPTSEHFDPLFFMLGAAEGDPPSRLFQTMTMGNLLLTILLCRAQAPA